MPDRVKIGDRWVGQGEPCFVIAEIGLNHNGDIRIAKKLIDAAALAGCDAVKFQKRTPELCVLLQQRDIRARRPGGITYLEYRKRVEFGETEYADIDDYCRTRGSSGSPPAGMSRRSSSSSVRSRLLQGRLGLADRCGPAESVSHRPAGHPLDGHVHDRGDRRGRGAAQGRPATHRAGDQHLPECPRGAQPAHDRHAEIPRTMRRSATRATRSACRRPARR